MASGGSNNNGEIEVKQVVCSVLYYCNITPSAFILLYANTIMD